MSSFLLSGLRQLRSAERQSRASLAQLPPRITRYRADLGPAGSFSCQSAHHCHTLPCRSYNPQAFGSFCPTGCVMDPREPAVAVLKGVDGQEMDDEHGDEDQNVVLVGADRVVEPLHQFPGLARRVEGCGRFKDDAHVVSGVVEDRHVVRQFLVLRSLGAGGWCTRTPERSWQDRAVVLRLLGTVASGLCCSALILTFIPASAKILSVILLLQAGFGMLSVYADRCPPRSEFLSLT